MKISKATMTLETVEYLQNKGYVVELEADSEYAEINKANGPEISQEAICA